MTIQEKINNNELREVINRYNLQVIHEDNDTYIVEDMNRKRSMTHGTIIKVFQTDIELLNYLNYLKYC